MQTLTRLSAAFAIALTALALAAPTVRPAAAQGAGEVPLVVAVLDIQKVMRESTAARAIQAELEEQRETYQAELAQQERKLRAADQDLAADRPTLSQEAFAERREDLEEQATQLRRDVQTRKEQLEAMYNEGMTQIRQALIEVVAEVARERGATLVLSKSQVVMASSAFDITEEVMQKLNAKLPEVSLAAPQ